MNTSFKKCAMALALGGAMTSNLMADDSAEVKAQLNALQATVKAQQAELQQLHAAAGDTWLNERRAEEIKGLVKEVLSDADTRSSLAEGGVTAGHKDHFFVASEDGNFLMNFWGLGQFRYVLEHSRDGANAGGKHTNSGFEFARVEIGANGHMFDPKLTYAVDFIVSNNGDGLSDSRSDLALQNAWVAYDVADGWNVKVGQFKNAFLREDMIGDGQQLAVERSLISALFGAGYVQGVQGTYHTDAVRVIVAFHDGVNSANTPFAGSGADDVDYAATGRVELLLAGKWSQGDDFVTWSGDSTAILLGLAVEYDRSSAGSSDTSNDQLRWTADVTVKLPEVAGLSLYGAIVGSHPNHRDTTDPDDDQQSANQFAFILQASVFVIPDKMDVFGRWENINLDNTNPNGGQTLGGAPDRANVITAGANYYFHHHALKATLDVVWAIDPTIASGATTSSAVGILGSDRSNEYAIRGQLQFMY
jgi:hypothetical protein